MSVAEESPRPSAVILGSGVLYALAFLFNEYALSFTYFSDGVNWVYLPSGLRLTLVLLFGWQAALGIALSSFMLAAWPQAQSEWPHAVVTGLISGFAPWLALLASQRLLHLKQDLDDLRVTSLLALAFIFAVFSAGMHQAWYGWRKSPEDLFYPFAVMTVGDLIGSVIVLYLCKWALAALTSRGR